MEAYKAGCTGLGAPEPCLCWQKKRARVGLTKSQTGSFVGDRLNMIMFTPDWVSLYRKCKLVSHKDPVQGVGLGGLAVRHKLARLSQIIALLR